MKEYFLELWRHDTFLPRLDTVIITVIFVGAPAAVVALVLIFWHSAPNAIPPYALPVLPGTLSLGSSIPSILCWQGSALGLTNETRLCEIWKAQEEQKLSFSNNGRHLGVLQMLPTFPCRSAPPRSR